MSQNAYTFFPKPSYLGTHLLSNRCSSTILTKAFPNDDDEFRLSKRRIFVGSFGPV